MSPTLCLAISPTRLSFLQGRWVTPGWFRSHPPTRDAGGLGAKPRPPALLHSDCHPSVAQPAVQLPLETACRLSLRSSDSSLDLGLAYSHLRPPTWCWDAGSTGAPNQQSPLCREEAEIPAIAADSRRVRVDIFNRTPYQRVSVGLQFALEVDLVSEGTARFPNVVALKSGTIGVGATHARTARFSEASPLVVIGDGMPAAVALFQAADRRCRSRQIRPSA